MSDASQAPDTGIPPSAPPGNWEAAKTALVLFLPVLLVAMAVTVVVLLLGDQGEMADWRSGEAHIVTLQTAVIESDIHLAVSDLMILSRSAPVENIWSANGEVLPEGLEELAQEFQNLIGQRKLYDKARLLDARGKELVRVNFDDGAPAVVAPDELQDKRNRYYFRDGFSLGKDEVYVSPLDLNIEHGEIEVPLKPIIRYATPVFDGQGTKRGLVVLSFLGRRLLDRFEQQANTLSGDQAMLLNADGYWLKGPNPEDEWGFMYRDKLDRTFASAYPEVWNQIRQADWWQQETRHGLFTIATVSPLHEGLKTSTGSGRPLAPSTRPLAPQDYCWKVVSFVPADVLWKGRAARRTAAGSVLALVLAVAGGASWLLAKSRVLRQRSEQEQMRLDAELRTRRERERAREFLQTVIDGFPEAVMVINRDHSIALANRMARELADGQDPAESGLTCHQVNHGVATASECNKQDCPLLQAIETGEVVTGEHIHRDAHGREAAIELIAAPIFDENGQVAQVIESCRDISSRKQAEQALRESESRFRQLSNATWEAIAIHEEGNVLEANEQYFEMFGLDPENFNGRGALERTASRKSQEHIRSQIAAGNLGPYKATGVRADGSTFAMEVRVRMMDYHGRQVRVAAIRDVSAREKAERALRISERKHRMIVENIPGVTYLCALDKNWTMQAMHGNVEQVIGYPPSDFIDNAVRTYESIIHPEDAPYVEEQVKGAVEAGRPWEIEYRIQHKDGSVRWIYEKGNPVSRGDEGVFLEGLLLDVTERNEAEAAIAAERDRAASYLALASVIFVALDREARVTLINQKGCEVLGYEEHEVLGRNWFQEFLPPDKGAQVSAVFQQLMAGAFPYAEYFENPVLTRKGDIRLIAWHNSLLRDGEGRIVGTLSCGEDITDRKRRENSVAAQLRLSEFAANHSVKELLQAFLDESEQLTDSSIGFYHFVAQDQITLQLQTWSTNTLKKMCTAEGEGKAYPIEQAGVWADCVRQGGPVIHNDYASLPHRKGLPEGHAPIIRELVVPVYREGKAVAVLGVGNKKTNYLQEDVETVSELANMAWDIVGRKRAEEALRENEERLQTVLTSSADYITMLDTEHRIQFINRTEPGFAVENLINMPIHEVVRPEDHDTVKSSLDRVIQLGEQQRFETLHRRPNGEVVHFSSVAVPLVSSGRIQGSVVSSRDVTEIRRAQEEKASLERQVQHAQKLESLGVLAGGIAHDFNNLLMAILGNADLALDELSPHAPARENIEEIERACKRAADLARQMLAYSGKGRFVVEEIDLGEVVREMAHLLEVSISKKAMLRLDFADNLPRVEGDATQIRQVIMNLITNASEAIEEKSGAIALSTGAMACDRAYLDDVDATVRASLDEPLPEGVYCYLEVVDTGCGMDQDTLQKVFDPFFTTKFTGRGLGMSAVLGIVRGHKGALKVHSKVGKGTTFRVLFPAIAPPPIQDKQEENQAADRASSVDTPFSGTVLIADDEETVCTVGAQMLKRMGFRVLSAADGEQAVDIFREHSEEIVCALIDLTMPRMDGQQVFQEIRRIRPEIKVILSSGYSEQEATDRFGEDGLAGFIQKPYGSSALRKKLAEIMLQ